MSTENLADLAAHIESRMPDAVRSTQIVVGELTVLAERDHILALLRFLRDDQQCNFETLIDICGVDYPERGERFEVVYHLLSMRMNHRVRVRIRTDEETPVVSCVPIWPAANWFEREAFDLFGIVFEGHADLRRILTDYGFIGHPFRKDFPISGHVEMRYDAERQRVIYQPVTIEPREITPRVVREENYGGLR
ncbi:MAG TPA: NADH-quinone oxidoreductase subunit C [Hyphomonas sp.]|nr:NADH-quinone oxidoreductase subunit C [Hyphomonas sp.]